MSSHTHLIDTIIEKVGATSGIEVLDAPGIGETTRQNELLMFAKPEIFTVGSADAMRAGLELLLGKLDEFGGEVRGAAIVGGPALEAKEIMNRHYGYINLLSRTASQTVSAEDRAKIEEVLGVSLAEYTLYGGHEFWKAHPSYTAASLDGLWATKKSGRVRGGFYVNAHEVEGEKFVLVNGFHPVQLEHFTEPSHRIVLFLIHSDTAWGTLRNNLIGATDPAKADPGSIRGMLYADPAKYGFESVGAGNNGVHLSAGPYEGAFEILNFFGNLTDYSVEAAPPLIIRKLMAQGLTLEQALEVNNNPSVTVNGETKALFGVTEDVDTDAAVELYLAGRSA